jgi:hypothetical protein
LKIIVQHLIIAKTFQVTVYFVFIKNVTEIVHLMHRLVMMIEKQFLFTKGAYFFVACKKAEENCPDD